MFNCGRQLRIVAALPQEGKLTQGPSHVLIILVIYKDFQRTQQILTSLRPLLSLLRRYAQIVVGTGLAVAVVVFDGELQGVLVVLFGLLELALLLCHPPQVVLST